MDNNKNRLKDRPKSKAEMRKMYFEHGSELGELPKHNRSFHILFFL